MKLVPVILSGGSGSRLWPVSRLARPKPFIQLADGQSLLQKAFLRALALPDVKEVVTVTNRDLFFQTEDNLRPVNTSNCATRFVLEPFGRNTAAACAAAALEAQAVHGPEAVLLVLPADHLIEDLGAFSTAVAQAAQLAQDGKLVTFGITPTHPETGYGYIEAQGSNVLRFVEKPSLEKAQEYLAAGNFLWNGGMFCFSAGTLLTEMQAHAPDVVETTRAALAQAQRSTGEGTACVEILAAAFEKTPDISIDYALMERSRNIAVVPCSMGWNDIGSWTALGDLCQVVDETGNRVQGDVVLHDTQNCFIQSPDRVVGCVGVRDLLIVDTSDALLVASRDSAQDVKHLFAELRSRAHEASSHHPTVHRPWGSYTVLAEHEGYKIKRIEVKPGGRLSLQSHKHRSEHWIILNGTAGVVNGEEEVIVHTGQSTYIPAGRKHRLFNEGGTPLAIIEIQTGSYLGEDDIERFDDIYGRAQSA